jgi:hypothetical protein
MAWTTSACFAYTVGQTLAKAVSWSTDSMKVALYASNTMTPDKTVTTQVLTEYNGAASQWVTANEVSGTGYTAGGTAITPLALTQNYNSQGNNTIAWVSSGSPQWTSATISAYGCLCYDTTVSSEGLCFNYFGGQQTVTGGTFTIAWNANGIALFSC